MVFLRQLQYPYILLCCTKGGRGLFDAILPLGVTAHFFYGNFLMN